MKDYIEEYPGGCTVGDKFFSSFTFSATGDDAPKNAGYIDVYVYNTDPLGLFFSSKEWKVGGKDQSQTTTITYLVTIIGGIDVISGATLGIADVKAEKTGQVTISKMLCLGFDPYCADPVTITQGFSSDTAFWSGSVSLDHTLQLAVRDVITLSTGDDKKAKAQIEEWKYDKKGGVWEGGYVFNRFDQVSIPEPVSWLLLSAGLVALGVMRRRVRKP